MLGVVLGAVGVGIGSSGTVAQVDETADLRTRVAELETAAARQSRQIATLAGGSDPTVTADAAATAAPVPAARTSTLQAGGETTSEAEGTREEPIPLGTAADAGSEWTLTVLGADPDGTDEILAENRFNAPPEVGRQFFLIQISATYSGTGSASILAGLTFRAVGDTAVAHDSQSGCGALPDPLPLTEVFEGGTIEGNVIFALASEDADSIVLYTDSVATLFDEEDRVYY